MPWTITVRIKMNTWHFGMQFCIWRSKFHRAPPQEPTFFSNSTLSVLCTCARLAQTTLVGFVGVGSGPACRPYCRKEVHNDLEKNDVFMSINHAFRDWPLKQGRCNGQASPAQWLHHLSALSTSLLSITPKNPVWSSDESSPFPQHYYQIWVLTAQHC